MTGQASRRLAADAAGRVRRSCESSGFERSRGAFSPIAARLTDAIRHKRRRVSMHKLDRRKAAGFSLIELLVVMAIIMIIMGMAIPPLTKPKKFAFEAGAMKAISTIHVAQAQYQSQYGGL